MMSWPISRARSSPMVVAMFLAALDPAFPSTFSTLLSARRMGRRGQPGYRWPLPEARRHREGTALNNLGLALAEARRFEEAIIAHQDAAAIYRDTGDRHREGLVLEGLGLVLDEAGRSREAMTAYQDAIAIYRETGDQDREAARGACHMPLGAAWSVRGPRSH
jgi:tetratricopeptide (TPR) repeat protein